MNKLYILKSAWKTGPESNMAASIVISLLLSFLDITLSTFLLLQFNLSRNAWADAVVNFRFCTSSLDLWFLACVRFSISIGAAVGLQLNTVNAFARVKRTRKPIYAIAFTMVVYVIAKFLASTECSHSKTDTNYLWAFFALSVVFSFGFACHWFMLGKTTLRHPVLVINEEQEVNSVLNRERQSSDSDSDSGSCSSEESNSSEPGVDRAKLSLTRLLSLSKSDFHYILVAFLCLLLASVGEMFIPYYTGQVIDGIAIEKNEAMFHRSIIIMAAISFATAICAGLRGGIFTVVMGRFYIRVNKRLFGSIIRQEIGFFDKTNTGDIVSRLTSDTSKMGEQVSLNINVFLRNVVTAVGVCAFMFHLSWKLSVLSLISIPIVAVISDVYGKYFQHLSKKVQTSIAKANEVAEEVISAMRTVRSFGNESGVECEYSKKLETTYKLKVKEAVAYGGYSWCTRVLELTMDALTLYYGGYLVMNGELTGGKLVSFILYQLSLGEAIEEIGDVYTGLVDAVGAAEKVFEYMDRKPRILNNGCVKPAEFQGSVEFKNVSFSYPSRPDSVVLQDVSFKVAPGEMVALVGPSGGGKSTCVHLLEHFYEPSEGEIYVDDVPVKDMDHQYLHTNVALVGQEPVLFARSIKENIAYNVENASEERVTKAAILSNAHGFITEMVKGYDTQTGEKGQQISGGQKQRVAIARALIRDPSLILFDEATSALDAESENKIQEAMFQNLKGRTIIVVAHRLSTIERADRIIVIEKGRIVESGRHLELMNNGGTYAGLVKHQLLTERSMEPGT